MAHDTPIYKLTVPDLTDAPDVPRDMSALALDIEAVLAASPASGLPATPADGQVARVKATANGPVWTFVYLAASTAPRWHFLGGAALYAEVNADTTGAGAANVWADSVDGLGPLVTVPLPGLWAVSIGARCYVNNMIMDMGFAIGAAAPDENMRVTWHGGTGAAAMSGWKTSQATVPIGGTVLKAKYRRSTGGDAIGLRVIQALPVRVG